MPGETYLRPGEDMRLARENLEAVLPWYVRGRRRREVLRAAEVFARAYARARGTNPTWPATWSGR